MQATEIRINKADFVRQMNKFAAEYGLAMKDVFHYQMALWGQDLAKKTWPQKKAIGKKAIQADVNRAFIVSDKFKGRRSLDEMLDHHEESRSKKTGRPRISFGRGGSEWRMLVNEKQARKVVTALAKRIGQVQAGWIPMIRKFRGKMPAKWITKHPAKGSAADNMTKKGQGYMVGVNKVPWVGRMTKGTIEATRRTREKDLMGFARKRLERLVEHANKMRAREAF
jgi:hypothetical protein